MTIIKNLFKKDTNASLGAIRLLSSIFGSLVVAYLLLIKFAQLLNFSIFENIVLAIILLPILWSSIGLWVVLSKTKIEALLKVIIPFILLFFIIYGLD
ncbi:conserved hypothetical protein [Arcobacter nitrofigilis DSM 7299]|uniref:Uncharacterized protein n=1 Tax=Arcobacter nitrofigilis (strain ATCC 33309 / DSM 7299 / CCUG 15893 / LMG 7604 / NCTC 12251 / CI) TaxID=572480 RepID=D5UZJ7_ARCNC|nr:hypothetical protein [Arcobacter nitrofigilis]ADG92234.1 conserved hypothetical protein [Arcobacter nitrofigilis DSM 7299]